MLTVIFLSTVKNKNLDIYHLMGVWGKHGTWTHWNLLDHEEVPVHATGVNPESMLKAEENR